MRLLERRDAGVFRPGVSVCWCSDSISLCCWLRGRQGEEKQCFDKFNAPDCCWCVIAVVWGLTVTAVPMFRWQGKEQQGNLAATLYGNVTVST